MLHARRKKSVNWTIFDTFLRRVSFPFKCGKAIFWRYRWLKSQNFFTPHGVIEFSKLTNLCLVKIFSLNSTPADRGFVSEKAIKWFWTTTGCFTLSQMFFKILKVYPELWGCFIFGFTMPHLRPTIISSKNH